MRITVEDFKGITRIDDFRLEQISVLAGTNSGGKSSLVQFIMLLKQSLEARSPEAPLKLNKPYVSLGRFENLLRRATGVKSFKATIVLEQEDMDQRLSEVLAGKRKVPGIQTDALQHVSEVKITAEFKKPTTKVVVSNFEIAVVGNRTSTLQISRKPHGKSYTIRTNSDHLFFRRALFRHTGVEGDQRLPTARTSVRTYEGRVGYAAFFPAELDIDPIGNEYVFFSPVLSYIKNSLYAAFERISYIGPLREEPREFYYHDDDLIEHIGNKGENAAFLLAKHADDQVEFTRFIDARDGPTTELRKGTLRQAVNYWLCDVFDLAKEVKVDRAKTNRYLYSVSLRNKDGSTIPITHVGFGVSQIFPILVEGLRSNQERRLIILEQPEIHLHPRVQSWLFDFIRTAPNSSFLVETHSDHFINRLRRRVAEDLADTLHQKINLTFVSPSPVGAAYERLELSSSGSLTTWPVGFFDQYEDDVRAIVRAQAAKRRQKKG
jgi:predicted ATPase